MEMTGEYRILAPRNVVWTALNDADVLKHCLRGCERLERIGDSRMLGTVTARVGPVKVTLDIKITLSEIDPPNGYRIDGEGKAGPAGYVKGGARVMLADDGGNTVLNYTVDAALGGKLAQMGSRVIDAAAKKMADDFFHKISDEVSHAAVDPVADEQAPAAPAAGTTGVQQHSFGTWKWWILAGAAAVMTGVALALLS